MGEHWEERWSRSRNRPYYYQPDSRQSQWERPTGDGVTVTPMDPSNIPSGGGGDDAGAKPSQIRASHLLVKHSGSRRPSSWREEHITRSKDEAHRIIASYRDKIVSGETDLGTLAETQSDCGSAKKQGDLGWFGRGQMQAAFENAAYALEVGQLSEAVESDSGVHLILRTG
ncbi:rotamase Pin1 [Entophlyctis helioformis]|nr:rotamase Pin1 [Entophlyctis helioformis]